MKKYVRYYLISKINSGAYSKVESDLPFSEAEGRAEVKSKHPDATKITHIAKNKAEGFLKLNQ